MALPGGDDAPDGDGWCLSLNPSDAVVVRFQEGLEPLAYLYVPDLQVQIGIMDGNQSSNAATNAFFMMLAYIFHNKISFLGHSQVIGF